VNGSILDDEMLKRVYKFKEKPDYVFHLAAHFANRNSVDNPDEVKNHEILRDQHNTFSFLQKENLAYAKRKTSLF
jgi:UDP-glucose 4-epimerase